MKYVNNEVMEATKTWLCMLGAGVMLVVSTVAILGVLGLLLWGWLMLIGAHF
jgi:hypothetical protein